MASIGALIGTGAARLALRAAARLISPRAPPAFPVLAMGLHLANPLGLAAGFDRNGALLRALPLCGFGFVEIGTVRLRDTFGRRALAHLASPRSLPVGINFAGASDGFGADALEEYRAAMRLLMPYADYLTANLSARHAGLRQHDAAWRRIGFVAALCRARDALASETGRRVPLAIKVPLGVASPMEFERLRAVGLDAVVGVGADETVIEEVALSLAPVPLVSVGGIRSSADIAARMARGATLVQLHRAFTRGGPLSPRRLLAGLDGTARSPRALMKSAR